MTVLSPATASSEFYRNPVPLRAEKRVASFPSLAGFRVEYVLSENELRDVDGVCIRELDFNIRKGGRQVIGHGRCLLLNIAPDTDALELLDAAIEHSDEYHELVDVLAGSCSEGIAVCRHGAVLALQYFELSKSLRGHGLGAAVARNLFKLLTSRFRCCLTVWKPFPLQYLDSALDSFSRQENREFKAAVRRLRNHYRVSWEGQDLARSGWLGWVPPRLNGYVEHCDDHWRLAPFTESPSPNV